MFINHSSRQVTAKIVYYGPGLSGKTTNLQYIFSVTSPKTRGELVSVETEIDRTLFFDLLPINVGLINGYQTRFQLYTVPGQIFYDATRKLVLKGVDGIVFVVDSQEMREQASLESFENLKKNLATYNTDLSQVPLVFQFNKRDLKNISSVERLKKLFHIVDTAYFEAISTDGIGVIDTLREISSVTLKKIKKVLSHPREMVKTTTVNFDTNSHQEIIKKEELPFKKIPLDKMENLRRDIFDAQALQSQSQESLVADSQDRDVEFDTLVESDEFPVPTLGEEGIGESDALITLEPEEMVEVQKNPLPEPTCGEFASFPEDDLGEKDEAGFPGEMAEKKPGIGWPVKSGNKEYDTVKEEEFPFPDFPEDGDLEINIEDNSAVVELAREEMLTDETRIRREETVKPAFPPDLVEIDAKDLPFHIPEEDIEVWLDIKDKDGRRGEENDEIKEEKKPASRFNLDETRVTEILGTLVDKTRMTIIKEVRIKEPHLFVEIKDRSGRPIESMVLKVDQEIKKITIILDIKK
ncbi:MAG: hypothetical protein EHM12_10440 [Dehalococcoidia bacterium]|nr:MAG: hypothetical protein EHM12_10440 [Dehalococcoidia bacterium]